MTFLLIIILCILAALVVTSVGARLGWGPGATLLLCILIAVLIGLVIR